MSNSKLEELKPHINWVVSDWHFGERRLDILCRPFESTEDHDHALIENHNRLVKPDDVVLCVGDVTNKDSTESLHLVKKLNGRKILIRGNHDAPHSDQDLYQYFEYVAPHGHGFGFEYVEEKKNGEKIKHELYANHYPTQGCRDRFNIVGHVHGVWRCQLNMLNVSVDNFGFAPCPIEKVPFFKQAITKFYDRDVWVAYEEVNTLFRETRGAKSRYLDKDQRE